MIPCICEWKCYLKEWWLILTKSKYAGKYVIILKDGTVIYRWTKSHENDWLEKVEQERNKFKKKEHDDTHSKPT